MNKSLEDEQQKEVFVSLLSIVSAPVDDSNKWKFCDDKKSFYAEIKDPTFLFIIGSTKKFWNLKFRARVEKDVQGNYYIDKVFRFYPNQKANPKAKTNEPMWFKIIEISAYALVLLSLVAISSIMFCLKTNA